MIGLNWGKTRVYMEIAIDAVSFPVLAFNHELKGKRRRDNLRPEGLALVNKPKNCQSN
jgi:hypothetical protein